MMLGEGPDQSPPSADRGAGAIWALYEYFVETLKDLHFACSAYLRHYYTYSYIRSLLTPLLSFRSPAQMLAAIFRPANLTTGEAHNARHYHRSLEYLVWVWTIRFPARYDYFEQSG